MFQLANVASISEQECWGDERKEEELRMKNSQYLTPYGLALAMQAHRRRCHVYSEALYGTQGRRFEHPALFFLTVKYDVATITHSNAMRNTQPARLAFCFAKPLQPSALRSAQKRIRIPDCPRLRKLRLILTETAGDQSCQHGSLYYADAEMSSEGVAAPLYRNPGLLCDRLPVTRKVGPPMSWSIELFEKIKIMPQHRQTQEFYPPVPIELKGGGKKEMMR
ncbi:hypothetical protein OSTOST_14489 [Ostertagia ostertagi]